MCKKQYQTELEVVTASPMSGVLQLSGSNQLRQDENMHNPTADEIIEDLKRFPKHSRLPLDYDSLGSPYTAFKTTPEIIQALARHPVVNAFRRVVLEPTRGFVMLTSPSSTHETLARQVDKIVDAAIEILSLAGHTLGSTRWSNQGEGNDTGAEPDCCYYLGENALAYLSAYDNNDEEAFIAEHPPGLVVEVAVTHEDPDKQMAYRDKSVPEYWHVKASQGERGTRRTPPDIEFLDLQAQGGPATFPTSQALPGLTPAMVTACLMLDRERIRQFGYTRAIRDILVEHGLHPVAEAVEETPAQVSSSIPSPNKI